MRNKLPCTARTLSQLQPDMIQSVVGAQVFQLGKEYHSANCVQIIEADNDQILSEVTGPFGLYEQTIQLKGGHLLTKCSCTSSEEPFCRHCVAVLLGYQQPSSPRDSSGVSDIPVSVDPVDPAESSSSPLNVNLHHITIFIEWLQNAMRALDRGQTLPEVPALEPGDVMSWVRGIQNLHARWRLSEEKRLTAEADLLQRETQFDRLMQEFETLPADAKEAEATCNEIQNTLANARGLLDKLCDMAKEQKRLESELTSTADDLLHKSSKLNSRFGSIRELSTVIENVGGASAH
jgi:hypothetical protein